MPRLKVAAKPAPVQGTRSIHPPLQLSCHADFDALGEAWRDLQARGLGTFYDTWEWCSAFLETIGRTAGIEARIIMGRRPSGEIAFLLPLAIVTRSHCRILTWATAPTLNYGFGLYDRGFLKQAGCDLQPWWPAIVKAVGPHDAVHLTALPAEWLGTPHPLRLLFTSRSANDGYVTALTGDYETLHAAHRSSGSRRAARKRDARLARTGTVRFGLPQRGAEEAAAIETLFAQHQQRMKEMGISCGDQAPERAFLRALAARSGAEGPRLALYRLSVDDESLGIACGGIHDGTFHALVLSMAGSRWRSFSPGDAVLRRAIEACTTAGLAHFDFGAGQGNYKDPWIDRRVALHEMVRGITFRGLIYTGAVRLGIWVKRRIKTNPKLWALAKRLRRGLASGG
ncbi:CelD/BcsL family acetyltransferase involved in cellulose biosynthesis [Rhodoligotrophos appendicifer]|uniref:GNAT family N-acetyltransferase n=1 Tax=Rhodoligotrophos appendicifer TaxID=987056 RepID=UPI001478E982|nr:GNAT family N-acetyltransferase [Rhodoligotrophos appendicifer]